MDSNQNAEIYPGSVIPKSQNQAMQTQCKAKAMESTSNAKAMQGKGNRIWHMLRSRLQKQRNSNAKQKQCKAKAMQKLHAVAWLSSPGYDSVTIYCPEKAKAIAAGPGKKLSN